MFHTPEDNVPAGFLTSCNENIFQINAVRGIKYSSEAKNNKKMGSERWVLMDYS